MDSDQSADVLFKTIDINMFDYKNRYHTFIGKWNYDRMNNARCTSKRLAKAGFVCTATLKDPDAARCFICQHELLWDVDDDPAKEHATHRPDCEFVKINKPSEDYTIKDWIRLLAYANSVQMYPTVAETISTLESAVARLVSNMEKAL